MKRLIIFTIALLLLAVSAPISAQEDVTLSMWTWKAFHIPGLEAVGEAFTEETGIAIEFEFFNPDDVYRSRIQTAAQSRDLPDILAYWSSAQFELAASGLLVEITDEVDEEWAGNFLPGTFENTSVWTQTQFDRCAADVECLQSNLEVGQVFSVPMAAGSSGIIFANKSMLEEAEIDPTFVPANTDEWLDMMTTVYEATGQGLTIGGKFEDIIRNWLVQDMALANCGTETFYNMIEGVEGFSFTDECASQAFGFVGQIAERDLWQPGFQTLTIDEADVSFTQDQAAFLVGGSYTLGFLIQQGMDPDNIHTFTLPALPTSQQNPIALAPFALIDVAVTANSDYPEEALQFIRFLTQPENMVEFARLTGELPAAAISTDPEIAGELIAGLAGSYTSASESYRIDWPPSGNEVWTALNLAANRQVTGEGTLEEALQEADDAAAFDREQREG